ncbi:MAG: Crp/Fnr family transcriptional regulator [Phycisphaerae bacterium]
MLDGATILRGCGFFRFLTPEKRLQLESLLVLKRFPKGTMIFRQGDACPGLFIVGSGLVRVFKLAPNGKEHVLHLVGPGATFAEVAAIAGFDCPAFAEAVEETECGLLPMKPFREMLETDHPLCLQLMGSMAGWVKHLVGLVEDITLRDAAGRVARYLLTASEESGGGDVTLPTLKKHLASHLNLTSETLSRTLRRLSEMGAIEMAGEKIGILNRGMLQDCTDGMGPLL